MPTSLWILLSVVAASLLYMLAVRRWLLAWGATPVEMAERLPGDTLLPDASSACTRAITVNAPPERVWPWIAQIGQGKGGFYSYAWLENLFGCRIVNAAEVHSEWQDVQPGDAVRVHPKIPGLPVRVVEKDRALVLGGNAIPEQHIPATTWAFVLEPADGNRTRLLVRWRSQTSRSLYDLVFNKYLLEPIHFTMERKMLVGIRRRAETQIGVS
jgi:hypothetical protein